MFGASLKQLVEQARSLVDEHEAAAHITPEQLAARQMSLATFVQAAWHVVEPTTRLVWNWHLTAICEHVQALLTGKLGKRNLLINVPPGFAKSSVCSVMAPAWRWINRPSWRAIFASGNPSVSTRDSLKCREILDSQWYRQTFGVAWTFAADQNLKTNYQNSATGFRMAVSASARVTGDRADSLFVDDALDADDCYSQAARDAVLRWWDITFANRLNSLETGTRCVVQQRLHSEDLAGHILDTEGGAWEHLCIPQEFETSRRRVTSLGWTDPRKVDGELAFPARFSAEAIAAERLRLGTSAYAGQHQQRPSAAEGEIFKRGFLQLWPVGAPLPEFSLVVQSWDCAFKAKESSDYSVGFELGQFERGVFILDRVRGRFSYPALKEAALSWGVHTRPAAVLVEDAASGQSLIQDLQQQTDLPVVPVKVDGDKMVRAHTIVPTWESNRIYVRADAPWLQEFLDELYTFPKGAHDDQCDAFVQGVRWLTQGLHEPGWLTYSTQEAADHIARQTGPQRPGGQIIPGVTLGSAMSPVEIVAYKRKHATPIH